MNTLTINKPIPFAQNINFDKHLMLIELTDGRVIGIPLEWFPRLRNANDEQRKNWRLIGKGIGIHWEDIDEDILVESLL
ncbi:MAG: DUF2442 domain-containing protein [Ignavibacteriota bacterium]|nr:DUF2442 domain-containing protein [Ignavibacteriota bacterium]